MGALKTATEQPTDYDFLASAAFRVVDVKVKMDSLKLAVRGSKHSTLINLFKPLAMGLMKKAIAKAIEEGIRSGLQQVDAQLADISERVDEADDAEGTNKFAKVKSAFQEKKEAAKREKDEKTRECSRRVLRLGVKKLTRVPPHSRWSIPNHYFPRLASHQLVERELDGREAGRGEGQGSVWSRLEERGFRHLRHYAQVVVDHRQHVLESICWRRRCYHWRWRRCHRRHDRSPLV